MTDASSQQPLQFVGCGFYQCTEFAIHEIRCVGDSGTLGFLCDRHADSYEREWARNTTENEGSHEDA